MPLRWDELETAVDAGDATMLVVGAGDVVSRLEQVGDLFRPLLDLRQTLPNG